jgi:hypothetical protein
MEGELWAVLYRVITDEGGRRPPARRARRARHADAAILLVLAWAALHDRPVCWACRGEGWAGCPAGERPPALPSPATMGRRLRSVATLWLLAQVLGRLAALVPPPLVRRVDGKPLPVGGRSGDRDARWGQAADHKARGYKLFVAWGAGVVPDAWAAGPMNEAEPDVARRLVPRLAGGGYLLGDALYDSTPLHAVCDARGFQLVAPRKAPGAGLGHGRHEPGRLRSIALLEAPAAGGRRPPRRRPGAVRPGAARPAVAGRAGARRVVHVRRRARAAAGLGPHPAPGRLLDGRQAGDQRRPAV